MRQIWQHAFRLPMSIAARIDPSNFSAFMLRMSGLLDAHPQMPNSPAAYTGSLRQ
jgi:hypothetical protein